MRKSYWWWNDLYYFSFAAYTFSAGTQSVKYTQKRFRADKNKTSDNTNEEYEKLKAILDKYYGHNDLLHSYHNYPHVQPKKLTDQTQKECEVIINKLFPEDTSYTGIVNSSAAVNDEIANEASKIEELTLSLGGLNIPTYKSTSNKTDDSYKIIDETHDQNVCAFVNAGAQTANDKNTSTEKANDENASAKINEQNNWIEHIGSIESEILSKKNEIILNKTMQYTEPYYINAFTNMASAIIPNKVLFKKDDQERPIITGENMPLTEVPTVVGEYARLPRQPTLNKKDKEKQKPHDKSEYLSSKVENDLIGMEVKNYSFDPTLLNVTYKFCHTPSKNIVTEGRKTPVNEVYTKIVKMEERLQQYNVGVNKNWIEQGRAHVVPGDNSTIVMEADLPKKVAPTEKCRTQSLIEKEIDASDLRQQKNRIKASSVLHSSPQLLDKSIPVENSGGQLSLTQMLEVLRLRAQEEWINAYVNSNEFIKTPPPYCQPIRRSLTLQSKPIECQQSVARSCPCPPACSPCPKMPECHFEGCCNDGMISYPHHPCESNLALNLAIDTDAVDIIGPLKTPYDALINHLTISETKTDSSASTYPCLPCSASTCVFSIKECFDEPKTSDKEILELKFDWSTNPPFMKSSFLPLETPIFIKDIMLIFYYKMDLLKAFVKGIVKDDNSCGIVRVRGKTFDPWVPIPSIPHPSPPRRPPMKSRLNRSCDYCPPRTGCSKRLCRVSQKWETTKKP